MTQDYFLVPFLFVLYTLFLCNHNYSCGLKYNMQVDKSKIFISSLDISPVLQIHIFIYLLVSAWKSQRHLKLNMSQTKINDLYSLPSNFLLFLCILSTLSHYYPRHSGQKPGSQLKLLSLPSFITFNHSLCPVNANS